MGSVTFSIPAGLATALIEAAGLRFAVETGTYLGSSALLLADVVDHVWSCELKPEILSQARDLTAHKTNISLYGGYSPELLPTMLASIPGPALFWLDGHGGTFGADDTPSHIRECPVLEELAALNGFAHAGDSVILIDDARAFFGPMLQHRAEDWPTFVEVADALGRDRYVTVLDDVIIAVPRRLRPVVDEWWRSKLRERDGLEAHTFLIAKLMDPAWVAEFKRQMG